MDFANICVNTALSTREAFQETTNSRFVGLTTGRLESKDMQSLFLQVIYRAEKVLKCL